jgi:hypothetical protein
LRWISRSQRHLVKNLAELGFKVGQRLVANLLLELNYSCQANSETREGGKHPDRDAQSTHINETVEAAVNAGDLRRYDDEGAGRRLQEQWLRAAS